MPKNISEHGAHYRRRVSPSMRRPIDCCRGLSKPIALRPQSAAPEMVHGSQFAHRGPRDVAAGRGPRQSTRRPAGGASCPLPWHRRAQAWAPPSVTQPPNGRVWHGVAPTSPRQSVRASVGRAALGERSELLMDVKGLAILPGGGSVCRTIKKCRWDRDFCFRISVCIPATGPKVRIEPDFSQTFENQTLFSLLLRVARRFYVCPIALPDSASGLTTCVAGYYVQAEVDSSLSQWKRQQ
jgi:hypothetical protein